MLKETENEMRAINPNHFMTEKRLVELVQLAINHYPLTAVRYAIQETVYAIRKGAPVNEVKGK